MFILFSETALEENSIDRWYCIEIKINRMTVLAQKSMSGNIGSSEVKKGRRLIFTATSWYKFLIFFKPALFFQPSLWELSFFDLADDGILVGSWGHNPSPLSGFDIVVPVWHMLHPTVGGQSRRGWGTTYYVGSALSGIEKMILERFWDFHLTCSPQYFIKN